MDGVFCPWPTTKFETEWVTWRDELDGLWNVTGHAEVDGGDVDNAAQFEPASPRQSGGAAAGT